MRGQLYYQGKYVYVARLEYGSRATFSSSVQFYAGRCEVPRGRIYGFAFFRETCVLKGAIYSHQISNVFKGVTFCARIIVIISYVFQGYASLVFRLAYYLPNAYSGLACASRDLEIETRRARSARVVGGVLYYSYLEASSKVYGYGVFQSSLIGIVTGRGRVRVLVRDICYV